MKQFLILTLMAAIVGSLVVTTWGNSPASTTNTMPSTATDVRDLKNGWYMFRMAGQWYLYRVTSGGQVLVEITR